MGVINYTTAKINELLDKIDKAPEKIENGKTPVFVTGTTTTLDPGLSATAEVVQDGVDDNGNPKYKINLGVPKGLDGASGGGGGVDDSVQWTKVLNKPSWVDSPTKPTYTASEVGALPAGTTIPSKTSQLTNDSKFLKSTDFKTINGQPIVGSGDISLSGAGGISDAPKDGKTYGRNNGLWVETSQMDEAPSDGNAYARKNKGWASVLESTEKALLNNYIKSDSYSAIEPTDNINTAIGKLEYALGTIPKDDIYYLPTAILSLTEKSSSGEIASAFGDIKSEIINALKEDKKFFILGDNNRSSTPVYIYNFYGAQLHISFFKKTVNDFYIVNIVYVGVYPDAINKISTIHPNGISLDSKINTLDADSQTSEISNIFGDIEDIDELAKNITAGNQIYTTLSNMTGSIKGSRVPLSVSISKDDSKYYIVVSGVAGLGFSSSLTVGHLYIEYDIASNTYTCQRFDLSLS